VGDDLAQQLYAAFRANVDPEQPNWGNLSALDREAWEVVATQARQTMAKRFVNSIVLLGPLADGMSVPQALDALKKSWSR
jgi:hypothetical protein